MATTNPFGSRHGAAVSGESNRASPMAWPISARRQKQRGIRGLDIAKRLLDYGFHAPTMYFPLIVDEALMI